jgi:hypothetical protein
MQLFGSMNALEGPDHSEFRNTIKLHLERRLIKTAAKVDATMILKSATVVETSERIKIDSKGKLVTIWERMISPTLS